VQRQRATHCVEKLMVVKRLGEKCVRARLNGRQFDGSIFASRDNDRTRAGRKRAKLRYDLQAAHLFHPDVENNERYRMSLNVRKKFLWLVEPANRKPVG